MIEIIPNFWISSLKKFNAERINTPLNKVKIDTTNKLSFIGKHRKYTGDLQKRILKNEILQLYKYVENVIKIVNDNINENVITVVCSTGDQISPLIATCYLIKYGNMSFENALNSIKSKHNSVVNDQLFFDNISKKIYSNYNEKK